MGMSVGLTERTRTDELTALRRILPEFGVALPLIVDVMLLVVVLAVVGLLLPLLLLSTLACLASCRC